MSSTKFNEKQIESAYPPGIENHFWNLARNKFIFSKIKRFKSRKILEIGCGNGVVTKFLRSNNIDIIGCDLTNGCSNSFLRYETDFRELSYKFRQEISNILLLDVLEHLDNPKVFIEEILEYYPKIRRIHFTVPARSELWSNYDDYYGHRKRYNLEDIHNLCCRKTKIESEQYLFQPLYLPLLAISKFYLFKRKENLVAPVGTAKILHRYFGNFMYYAQSIIPKHWYGTSMYFELKIH